LSYSIRISSTFLRGWNGIERNSRSQALQAAGEIVRIELTHFGGDDELLNYNHAIAVVDTVGEVNSVTVRCRGKVLNPIGKDEVIKLPEKININVLFSQTQLAHILRNFDSVEDFIDAHTRTTETTYIS
jgi:hypothetical protein